MQLLEFEGDSSSSNISVSNCNSNVCNDAMSKVPSTNINNTNISVLLWKSCISQDIIQQIIDLLLTITWDDVNKVDIIRQSRTTIANLLDVTLPSAIMQNNNERNKSKRVNNTNMDDFENYSSLIKDLNG